MHASPPSPYVRARAIILRGKRQEAAPTGDGWGGGRFYLQDKSGGQDTFARLFDSGLGGRRGSERAVRGMMGASS
jgi:hypothetical protein